MNVALLAVDSNHPNLALMKISAFHKMQGDIVDWYNPFDEYDVLYMSKIFTYTQDYLQIISNAKKIIKGGTGYDYKIMLDERIERLQPDYSIYKQIDNKTAYGFLTRGCPNECGFCIVSKKEGGIKPHMDIEEIAIDGRNRIILYDNNVLASDYGIKQIEKIIKMGLWVDFNQGLDARLVTEENAKLLAKVKWLDRRIRFGCDTKKQIDDCERAIRLIDKNGYKGQYFMYCILQNSFEEAFERVNHWRIKNKELKAAGKAERYYPHCQPYRRLDGKPQIIPQWQKDLADWADRRWSFSACEFKDFEVRKGVVCGMYFKK